MKFRPKHLFGSLTGIGLGVIAALHFKLFLAIISFISGVFAIFYAVGSVIEDDWRGPFQSL